MTRTALTVLAAWLALHAAPAVAEPTLTGREVTVYVLTYDDPARPLFFGRLHATTVGDGVEFGLEPEGVQNNLDVAPSLIDVGPTRIEISYAPTPPGMLATARFNGYIFAFAPKCLLFAGARIDREVTNVALQDSALTLHGPSLRLNVTGLVHDRATRIAFDLDIRDCPVS